MNSHFAEVYLDRAIDRPLFYSIPLELSKKVEIGSRLLVPLRGQEVKGTLISFCSSVPNSIAPLPIIAILPEERLSSSLVSLAEWMSYYYLTPLRKILLTFLPSPVRKGTSIATQRWVILLKQEVQERLSPSQKKLISLLAEYPKEGAALEEIRKKANISLSPFLSLEKRGILSLETVELDRSFQDEEEYVLTAKRSLNHDQKNALSKLLSYVETHQFHVELLFGVTGSGKTEVYLQAIEMTRSLGYGVLILVPEIALTTQTVDRLKSRFRERIAILHHRLSDGERFDAYRNIQQGRIQIVVGARSSIFSPIQNLGLIILDEEQDSSYKQMEEPPCYHARDVAVMRAKLESCPLLLGSATPSFETFSNVEKGKYGLSPLLKRAGMSQSPTIHIIDMRQEEERQKRKTLFSDLLIQKIKDRIEAGEQTLLFLNRRGFFSSQICAECRQVIECPHCDLSLTYHKNDSLLLCHLCGYQQPPTEGSCPHCHSTHSIRFRGVGTEQVERALHLLLPGVRTIRMDGDTTRNKGSHDRLFRSFRSAKADILIGTQMIAKGLDFPLVTLVGILEADSLLYCPDFRAAERAFQLLSQVAGRAGRGEWPGEVLLQTKIPSHPLISFIQTSCYEEFYREEISSRNQFYFPPFTRMIRLIYSSTSEPLCKQVAEKHFLQLNSRKELFSSSMLIYPVIPCGIAKIKDKYRLHILIKGTNSNDLHRLLAPLKIEKGVRLLIDVDPLDTFS